MVNIQKRMASEILKAGMSRVWLNPENLKEVDKAITKWDIRKLIKKGDIKELPAKIQVSGHSKKRKRGPGSRKGKKYAVVPRKRRWMSTVRPQRGMLKELKSTGKLDNANYRKLYNLVKGGVFRSRAHLKLYLEQNKLLK